MVAVVQVGALRRARSKLVLEVEQVLERVRGRVAVLRLDGEALCDMVVQQALTVEKAGDTARAKTLQVRRRTTEAPQVMRIRLHTALSPLDLLINQPS